MVELKDFFLLFSLLNYWVWVANMCPLLDVWRGVGGVTPLLKSDLYENRLLAAWMRPPDTTNRRHQ